MTHREKIEKKFNSLVYNHLWLKYTIEYGIALIFTILSAAIFSFGMTCFIDPNVLQTDLVEHSMVSGGTSGIAQLLQFVLNNFFNVAKGSSLIYSLSYLVINVPIGILAFKGVGKRFGVFTFLNVIFVSIFTTIFKGQFFIDIAKFINENAGMLGRALFAGVCTGLSSSIAFKIETSAGGFDVISYYFSIKNGNNVGPYVGIINAIVIASYAILTSITKNQLADGLGGMFFSLIYLFTAILIIDFVNVRNKKSQIEIVTDKEDLSEQLIAYIPHGATVLKGKGVYTGKERFVIHMVVSVNEVKRVVKIVQQLDENSFINVTNIYNVFGRFHMKPIK